MLSKVLTNSSIYVVVSILQKSVGFFLLPVYTSYLTTTDYGIVSIVTALVYFFSIVSGFALTGAVSWFYYKYKEFPEKVREIWGTCFTFTFICSIVISALLVIFREYLLFPFARGIDFYPYLLLGVIIIMLTPPYNIFQTSLQAMQSGRQYGLNNFLYFFINILLTIVFVVYFKMKATGVLLAGAVTGLVFCIYSFVDFVPRIKLGIDRQCLGESLKYSLPLVPHSLSGWLTSMIDRVFLNAMKTTADVGIYNIGFQFSNVLSVFTGSVNQAYAPWFFEQIKLGDEGKSRIVKYSLFLITLYSNIALCISLFAPDIMRFMVTKNFRDGYAVIPFLTGAFVFEGIYYLFCNTLFIDKTTIVPFVTFTGAFINMALNYFLIPGYGIIGASAASMIANAIVSAITVVLSLKICYIEFKWFYMYFCATSAITTAMLVLVKLPIGANQFFALKLAVFILFFTITFFKFRKDLVNYIKLAVARITG